jgi:peptide/nickel transport system substrate-binding protein
VDKYKLAIVTNTSTQVTQFLGKNLDHILTTSPVIPQILSSIKDAKFVITPGNSLFYFVFALAAGSNSPWKDPRVRQALNLALDRDAMNEAYWDSKKVNAAGVKLDPAWQGIVPACFSNERLDPKTDAKISKYFKYDLAEAKKLLSAAGVANGFSAGLIFSPTFSPPSSTEVELFQQFVAQVGVKLTAQPQDYAQFSSGALAGKFDGLASSPTGPIATDAGDFIEVTHTPGSATNRGQVNDPELTKKIEEFQSDFDEKSRTQKIKDVQVYLAEQMYYIPGQNSVIQVNALQPYMQNVVEYMNGPTGYDTYSMATDSLPFWWKDV